MPAIKLKKVTAQYLAEKEKKQAAEKKKNLEDVADEAQKRKETTQEEKEKKTKAFNFLDVKVLWEKRKRTVPVTEQKLQEWLTANLERREEEVYLSLPALYEYYAETCQLQGASVVDIPVFNKHVHDKFGSCFGFKETSPYKGLIKERKKKEKKARVQGETLNLKFKDILEEVISSAGNPRKGIRFGNLKVMVNAKYPALRVDLHPKKMKIALERGIRYGQVELVKGVGMCGFYRLPGEPDQEEETGKKDKKKKSKAQESEETEVDEAQSEEKDTANGAPEENKTETKKSRKRKTDDNDSKEEGAEGENQEATADSLKKKPKKKTQKRKKKKAEHRHRSSAARHCNPERIDDVFPLAITYQSDPKEASASRIKMYLQKYYADCNLDRLKRALENGVNKGMWEQVRGSGVGGSFRLLIDTFNPSDSDSMDDKICQAIVAGHEPKQASALLLKKYLQEYHPNFNIDAKPYLFRSALERACNKGTIRQLSGIGATGTFQLVDHFFPSPAILAGEMDEEEEEEEEVEEDYVGEVYIPRATKYGRGAGRVVGTKKPAGRRR